MKMKKILFILTQCNDLGNNHPTGVWFDELSTPYYIFTARGFFVDFATIKGGSVPFDPLSMASEYKTPTVDRLKSDAITWQKLQNSLRLSDVNLWDYDAVFTPGGRGAMGDLPNNSYCNQELGKAFARGQIIASVCHGPAILVNVKGADGKSIIAGRKVNSWKNSEEESIGASETMPFLLETRLRELGGDFHSAPNFQEFAIRDGNLITGQNPASSEKIAKLTIEAIEVAKSV